MTPILPDAIGREIEAMSIDAKRALAARLRAMIADEMAPAGAPDACPRCGCPEFVHKGHDARGRQRWLCC